MIFSLCFFLYFLSNKPLSQCYIMEIKKLPEQWISLPDLPVPTVIVFFFSKLINLIEI
jgi:hypothetical protein